MCEKKINFIFETCHGKISLITLVIQYTLYVVFKNNKIPMADFFFIVCICVSRVIWITYEYKFFKDQCV